MTNKSPESLEKRSEHVHKIVNGGIDEHISWHEMRIKILEQQKKQGCGGTELNIANLQDELHLSRAILYRDLEKHY